MLVSDVTPSPFRNVLLHIQVSPIQCRRRMTRDYEQQEERLIGGSSCRLASQTSTKFPYSPLKFGVFYLSFAFLACFIFFHNLWLESEQESILKTTSTSSISSFHRWRNQSLWGWCLCPLIQPVSGKGGGPGHPAPAPSHTVLIEAMHVNPFTSGCLWYSSMWSVLHRLMCLNVWNLVGDAILGGCTNFRRWGLAGGSRSLGVGGPFKVIPDPSFCLILSASCQQWSEEVSLPYTPTMMFCPSTWGHTTMDWLNPLEPWAKLNPSSLRLFLSGIWLH
jgi:hypothetical protein